MVQVRPDARLLHANLTRKANQTIWQVGLYPRNMDEKNKLGSC